MSITDSALIALELSLGLVDKELASSPLSDLTPLNVELLEHRDDIRKRTVIR
jgi:hypothetical protein